MVKELKDEHNNDDPSNKISCDTWISHFTKLFSVKSQFQRLNKDFEKRLGDLEKDKSFTELDFKITEKEVMQAIVKLKNGKSAGLDGVKYEMLKCGQSSLTPCIVKLFNHILSSGQYPKEWKNSYIKPPYKGDDPLNPSNYRGISIMSCISKLFSSVLNNRLQTSFFDKNKIINETQIGFQPKARTSDHMFVLRTLIEKYQSLDSKLYVCFVDFQKGI